MELLLDGLIAALSPTNLIALLVGCFLGTLVGILPGIGPTLAIALLLPVTLQFDASTALVLFAAIFYGAKFGGSITAVLINAPGEGSSVPTAMEGYPLAKLGRAGAALASAAIGGFVAGTIGIVLLSLLAEPLAKLGLMFGPAEFTALILFALAAVASLTGPSIPRGLLSALIGLLIGFVGVDFYSGQERFTFGIPELQGGIDIVIIVVGLFAVGEILWTVRRKHVTSKYIEMTTLYMTKDEWKRSVPAWLRGTAIGFPIGVLPGLGAAVAAFLAYGVESRISKTPERFGKGAIEGVAAAESADNAAAAGALVPMLALGIPGSAATAMMLVGLQMQNVQTGPLLFQNEPLLAWTVIASLYLANVVLLIINLPLIRLWTTIVKIPPAILTAAILIFSVLGAYSVNGQVVDVFILILAGVLGYAMRLLQLPLAPLIIAMVLGPLLELQFRRAVSIAAGDFLVFFKQPIPLAIIVVTVLFMALPPLFRKAKSLRSKVTSR